MKWTYNFGMTRVLFIYLHINSHFWNEIDIFLLKQCLNVNSVIILALNTLFLIFFHDFCRFSSFEFEFITSSIASLWRILWNSKKWCNRLRNILKNSIEKLLRNFLRNQNFVKKFLNHFFSREKNKKMVKRQN